MYFGCIGAAVILSLSGRINLSLLILVPLMPLTNVLYRFHKYPLGKDFVDIVLVAMLAGWILKSLSGGEKIVGPSPFNKVAVAIMLFTLFSVVQGTATFGKETFGLRLQTWKNYMVMPLLYFITYNNIKKLSQIKWLLVFMFAAVMLIDLYTSRQISFMPNLASRDKINGTFVFLGPNQLAAFYVQCLFLLLGIFIMHKEKLYRIATACLIASGLFMTLFLYSRAAYIALLVGLIALAVLKKRILIVPLALLLFSWEAILPATVIERIKETHTSNGNLDSSSQHRLELWQESIRLFTTSPLTGIGFDVIYHKGLIGTFKDTHNIYMKTLAEQGLVGITLLMTLLFIALKTGYRLYHEARDTFLQGLGLGFTLSVIGAMTTNVFGDRWTFIQIGAYFWVFMALASRGLMITEEEAAEEDAGEPAMEPAEE